MSEEREAFDVWYESEKMKYWLMCADKEMCFGIWQAALEWQAARQSAGATDCPHGVDDGACKQCYADATGQEAVAWMYEGTRIQALGSSSAHLLDTLRAQSNRLQSMAITAMFDAKWINELEAKCAELDKDAARWQYAKAHFFGMMSPDMGGNHDWVANGRGIGRGNTLDAAIDARIAAQAGSKEG